MSTGERRCPASAHTALKLPDSARHITDIAKRTRGLMRKAGLPEEENPARLISIRPSSGQIILCTDQRNRSGLLLPSRSQRTGVHHPQQRPLPRAGQGVPITLHTRRRQIQGVPGMSQVNRLMRHSPQDVPSHRRVIRLRRQLHSHREIPLSNSVLSIVKRHPAAEIRKLTSGGEHLTPQPVI
jgi:hypothetical protein